MRDLSAVDKGGPTRAFLSEVWRQLGSLKAPGCNNGMSRTLFETQSSGELWPQSNERLMIVGVGTRPVARDCTVARGIAHAIISRPEVPTENNAQDDREQDYTDGHHNKGPYGHDPYVTTIGKLAHDQHDRPTKTTNDRP